jgi:trypsin-like peptidase
MRSARLAPFWSALLSSSLLVACVVDEPESLGTFTQPSQCGPTWDAQEVEKYNGTLGATSAFVTRHERRVGYQVPTGCTGTLISDDLFISAGHCSWAAGQSVRFNYQNAPDGTARSTVDFPVAQVVEQEYNASWDYAIVRLSGSPGREYGHAIVAPIDPPAGSLLAIIHHPNHLPKQVHVGPLLDYTAALGANWFRHQVDTEGGGSGAGILDTAGRLVGIHTNGGCKTTAPLGGNEGIRMSRLVQHSPTLAALSRSKLVWRHSGGKISIWSLEPDGTRHGWAVEHGPFDGWTPISLSENRLLWRHTTGQASLWTIDDAGNYVSSVAHGPYDGWTPVSYANHRLLWRHTSGKISLWSVDDLGNYAGHIEHGPFPGWTAVNYANNRILWKHDTGQASLWVVDDAGHYLSSVAHGPYAGWSPLSYSNGEILWRHTSGVTSFWSVNRLGNLLSYVENGPYAGWTPIANVDGRQIWQHSSGTLSYWNTNSDGAYLGHVEHGPFAGWSALLTTGGRP